eukprot:CAMPEP_0181106362 /NCGR_PEP_ID=MMETSP1071-20121207/16491_1 /TAXON_ID=35127 /ORGANISM="Thalassiosira sp., Strain NH16" /LENGTH=40 /DNA_ID= /DNA_START= /DNA_END= /DNA_ORIENTATION=
MVLSIGIPVSLDVESYDAARLSGYSGASTRNPSDANASPM